MTKFFWLGRLGIQFGWANEDGCWFYVLKEGHRAWTYVTFNRIECGEPYPSIWRFVLGPISVAWAIARTQ